MKILLNDGDGCSVLVDSGDQQGVDTADLKAVLTKKFQANATGWKLIVVVLTMVLAVTAAILITKALVECCSASAAPIPLVVNNYLPTAPTAATSATPSLEGKTKAYPLSGGGAFVTNYDGTSVEVRAPCPDDKDCPKPKKRASVVPAPVPASCPCIQCPCPAQAVPAPQARVNPGATCVADEGSCSRREYTARPPAAEDGGTVYMRPVGDRR